MKMSLYLRALKALPNCFLDDRTRFVNIDDSSMIVIHPDYVPRRWNARTKHGWVNLEIRTAQGCSPRPIRTL